jgi:hypothetical protein
MAGVWGSDPIFDDMKEAQSILDALMLHYNAMGAALTKGRKQYRPYGWPTDDAERALTETAAEWSFGFWKGRQNEGGASPRARPCCQWSAISQQDTVSAISATAIMVVIDAPNIKSVTSMVVRVSSMLEWAGSSF